jgi:hypothetical protein
MDKKLKAGDWVEVISKEEILRTLDPKGELDGMPFMPAMFQYCGQRFQVYRRAHKTCDYTTSYPYHVRKLRDTVHLETRCGGETHGGCQAGCLLYWKQDWLRPVEDRTRNLVSIGTETVHGAVPALSGCREADLWARTQISDPEGGPPTYVCQATQVPYATTPLKWWDLRQYIEDYRSGNVGLGRILSALCYSIFYNLSQTGIGLGPTMRWFYDKLHSLWGGPRYPRTPGLIPEGKPTPSVTLSLQPGEFVRVKTHDEILKTVDSANKNRGMYWDAELVPYCGKTYRVLKRVTKIIDEKTAKMVEMKTPCIILDTVVCQARYSPCRMLCPKSMYPYWREIWLERVQVNEGDRSRTEDGKMTAMSSCQR